MSHSTVSSLPLGLARTGAPVLAGALALFWQNPRHPPAAERNAMKVRHEAPDTPRVPRRGPYSQVVRLGDLLFVAGQAGLDPKTGAAVSGFAAQARQAFENLRAVLEDAGSGLPHVVKTTCFLADPEGFDQLNALYAEYFPQTPPARSTPVVKLPRGLLFSIEAIAALPLPG